MYIVRGEMLVLLPCEQESRLQLTGCTHPQHKGRKQVPGHAGQSWALGLVLTSWFLVSSQTIAPDPASAR